MKKLLILFSVVLSLLVSTTVFAATISGTITNSTSKSGRLYVMLESNNGATGIGTSYANVTAGAAVPYTLRGVRPGDYTVVRAFLDTRGTGVPYSESPIGANFTSFAVATDADIVSGKDVVLSDITPAPTVTAPLNLSAAPLNNGVLLLWEPPVDGTYGIEIAHHYNVYWSTTPNPGPSNTVGGGSKTGIPSRDDGHVFIPLVNGGVYYFAVEAVVGAQTSTRISAGPVTIGPASGGHTVTALVNFNIAPASALLAVLMGNDDEFGGGSYITAPVQQQTITINGVPDGNYQLFMILDKNGNGLYDTGDVVYSDLDWKQPRVAVAGADVNMGGADMLVSRNLEAGLTTETWNNQWGASYNLNFEFNGQEKRPAHFVVSGPQLTTTDLSLNSWGEFRSWHNLSSAPTKGDSYSVTVTYTDASTETFTLQVTNVLTTSASPAFPTGSVRLDNNPRFGWNTISGIPGTPFMYHIALNQAYASGDYLFETLLPPDQTSFVYSGPALTVGTEYIWHIRMIDSQGNRSSRSVNFTPQASGPVITSISPSTLACGASDTIHIMGTFDPVVANNRIYLNNTQYPIIPTSATGSTLTFQLPDCATSYSPTGPVIVTSNGVSAASDSEFIPTFTYTGSVDDWNQNDLSGATIELVGSNPLVSTTSGTGGVYQLSGIPTGKLYRQKLLSSGTSPVYSAFLNGYYNTLPSSIGFALPPITYLASKGIAAGNGIIRARTRDNADNNVNGVTITAYSSRYGSTSKYSVKYGDCTSDTVLANDSRFCVMNVEDGDRIRVSGTKSGYTINARILQGEADAMGQGGLTATPIPTMLPVASTSAAMGASFDGTNYLVGVENHTATPPGIGAQLLNANGTKVGGQISTGRNGIAPFSAFDGTNHLLIWEDDPGGSRPGRFSIYGQFISRGGSTVGTPFAISTSGIWFDGIKTMAFGGGTYLVTYTRLINPELGDNSTNRYIAGRLVNPDGGTGSEFRISSGYGKASDVAFDGTNFFVVWSEDQYDQEIRGRFVAPNGTLGTEISVNASAAPSDNPKSVAFDGTNYLVAWNDEVSGQDTGTWDAFGQLVSKTGSLVGTSFAITNDPGPQVLSSVAFDGANYLASWVDMSNDSNYNGSCDALESSCWDVFGRYISTSGALLGNKVIINATAGNQFGGTGFVNGKYLALVNNGVVMGDGGVSQVEGVYAQFLSAMTPVPAAPTISSVSPPSGAPGSSIVVNGTNFLNGATTVTINGVASAVNFVSATQLNVTVPGGASSGPISVTTSGGTVTSSTSFTVIAPTARLTVNLPGTGSGSVNATRGISFVCSSPSTGCATEVTYGTNVTLEAAASLGSTFTSWSGPCVVNPCTFTMDGDKTAVATFTLQQNGRIGGVYFGTLQSALDAAMTSEIILMQALTVPDINPVSYRRSGVTATLKGGYDASFSGQTGYTGLDGVLILEQGTLIVDRLVIY